MQDALEQKYKDQPDCCRKVLIELERDGRTGSRNCAKGHLCRAVYGKAPPAKPSPSDAH
ncbi:MAG: hypothetical protein ACYCWW_02310 [Deltaproteobacteria bacterium]